MGGARRSDANNPIREIEDNMQIEANGITFHTEIDGREGAPWLTFSHSLGTNLTMWDDQIAVLADDYRIFRYDTRGHGESDVPAGPYDLDLLVGDVVALWDAVGIERSHFIGLSMGGMTGQGLALANPARVASLVACDCRGEADAQYLAIWQAMIPKVEAEGIAAVAETTLERWFGEAWIAANPEPLDRVRQMILSTDDAGYLGCAQALQGLDFLRHLGGLAVPALFLGGANDVGAPVATMDAMHEAVPGSRRAIIEDAGHIANIENIDGFNAAVTAFLSDL